MNDLTYPTTRIPYDDLPPNMRAYHDGWGTCGRGQVRHDRPNYITSEERDAFGKGWDDRQERLAMGYCDDA